jgi:hypothetical protein
VSLFYVGLDPAEKARKRKVRPTQPQLLEAVGTPEYLNLSLDSKVGKALKYMAGSDSSSSSSSSSRGNSSPKAKNTAHTSNYFSRVRRLAPNPILNSAGSAQNFARVLRAVVANWLGWPVGVLFLTSFRVVPGAPPAVTCWPSCAYFEARWVNLEERTCETRHIAFPAGLRPCDPTAM